MNLRYWGILQMATATGLLLVALFLTAAIFGLGGWSKARPLEESVSVSPPTTIAPASRAVVDASAVYQHSLFSLNRGVDTDSFQSIDTAAGAQNKSASTQDLNLLSVMITPSLTVAVFSRASEKPFRVKLGDALPNSNLVFSQALPRSVELSGAGMPVTLNLRVFDGQGGVSPSAAPASLIAPSNGSNTDSPSTPQTATESEAQLRQRLAQRRADLQQQNSQDQRP